MKKYLIPTLFFGLLLMSLFYIPALVKAGTTSQCAYVTISTIPSGVHLDCVPYLSATPTPSPTATPTPAPTPTIRPTATPTPVPTSTPTLTPITLNPNHFTFQGPGGKAQTATYLSGVPPFTLSGTYAGATVTTTNTALTIAALAISSGPQYVMITGANGAQTRFTYQVLAPGASPAPTSIPTTSPTAAPTAKPLAFDATIESLKPHVYYPLNDSRMVAEDLSGNALIGSYIGSYRQFGSALIGDSAPSTNFDFNGVAGFAQLNARVNALGSQLAYTEQVVAKQASPSAGGPLAGFDGLGNRIGTNRNFSLFESDAGLMSLYVVDSGTAYQVTSTRNYNDGNAHVVFGSVTMAGYTKGSVMTLSLNVSNSSGTLDTYTKSVYLVSGFAIPNLNHWNVGGLYLTGIPSAPASNYFQGSIEKAALYDRVLTSTEMQSLVSRSLASIPEPSPSPIIVQSTQDFIGKIGFDSHFNYRGTPYVNVPSTLDSVGALGLGAGLRDGSSQADYLYTTYGYKHGTQFYDLSSQTNPTQIVMNAIANLGGPDAVAFVEINNENDSGTLANHILPNTTWYGQDIADQKVLYSIMKQYYPNIPVLAPSLIRASDASYLAPAKPYVDAINSHDGTCGAGPEFQDQVATAFPPYIAAFGNIPIWTTEFELNDYQTFEASTNCKIDDQVFARYEMRNFAYRTSYLGESKIYQYQAVDMPTDNLFGSSGVIDQYGNYKPGAYALRTALGILPRNKTTNANCPTYTVSTGTAQDVYETPLYDYNTCRHYTILWYGVESGPTAPHGTNVPPPLPPAYALQNPVTGNVTVTLPNGDTEAWWGTYSDTTFTSMTFTPLTVTNGTVVLNNVTDQIGYLVSDQGQGWTIPTPLPTQVPNPSPVATPTQAPVPSTTPTPYNFGP